MAANKADLPDSVQTGFKAGVVCLLKKLGYESLQQWLGQDFRLTNHKGLLTPGLDHFLEGLKDFSTLLSAEGRNFRLVYYKITRSHDK